jgi:hypothetical protein
MLHPLARLAEANRHQRHIDVAELLNPRGHVRAHELDVMGEIESVHKNIKRRTTNKVRKEYSRKEKGSD